MLPYQNRLTEKKDFETVFASGKRFHSKLLSCFLFHKNSDEPSRFGIIITNKISKSAVERNRAKRLIRANLSEIIPILGGGYDVIILGKKEILKSNQSEIIVELQKVLPLHK